jgi:two-component system, chemotaxis family, chemotaxis protein CheY
MVGIVGGDRMLEQSQLHQVEEQKSARGGTVHPGASRLLVIDDDNLHRTIICRAAGRAGYLPTGAASYDEAVQMVRDTVFDCITLDLSLGDHAGVEILRHLWVIGCKAPVIIISGCDDATCSETERVAESLKLNVWESIPKPVDLSVLRASLERLRASREEASLGEQESPQISPA